MSRYLQTHICVGWVNPREAAQAESMGIAYEPQRNIRRACVDLMLVDHYTEAESDISGDLHPTVILQLQSGERMPILMKYEDFRAKIDAVRTEGNAIICTLDATTLKPV